MLLGACSSPEGPRSIPEFSMMLPDTTQVFHSKDIPYGKSAMIIWFDPNCRDCQIETEQMLAQFEKFRNVNIYLVTKEPYDELMVFYKHLRLDTCKNVTVGIDRNAAIARIYGIRGTPTTWVYNKDKILTGLFSGKAEPEDLIKIVNKKD